MSAPVISWALSANPASGVSALTLSKTGSQYGIPAGSTSDVVDLYLFNNLGGAEAVDAAYDCKLTTYDSESAQTETTAPVTARWLKHLQVGYRIGGGSEVVRSPAYGASQPDGGYALGGSTGKMPIHVRRSPDEVPADPTTLIGDTLPGGVGGDYVHLQVWLAVPAETTLSTVVLGLWLEYNYVS